MLTFLLIYLLTGSSSAPEPCQVYGTIYLSADRGISDCTVFVETTEGFAHLLVFEEKNRLYANKPGKWHFVTSPGLADYIVSVTDNRTQADFTIYLTETESFAGCP